MSKNGRRQRRQNGRAVRFEAVMASKDSGGRNKNGGGTLAARQKAYAASEKEIELISLIS